MYGLRQYVHRGKSKSNCFFNVIVNSCKFAILYKATKNSPIKFKKENLFLQPCNKLLTLSLSDSFNTDQKVTILTG